MTEARPRCKCHGTQTTGARHAPKASLKLFCNLRKAAITLQSLNMN
jgi:hypothetical protein